MVVMGGRVGCVSPALSGTWPAVGFHLYLIVEHLLFQCRHRCHCQWALAPVGQSWSHDSWVGIGTQAWLGAGVVPGEREQGGESCGNRRAVEVYFKK